MPKISEFCEGAEWARNRKLEMRVTDDQTAAPRERDEDEMGRMLCKARTRGEEMGRKGRREKGREKGAKRKEKKVGGK